MKDYVGIAKRYAKAAAADAKGKSHGKWIRLAAARFLADLTRAKRRGCAFYFSHDHATDVCDFIEKLPHVEGVWDSPTVVLDPSQVFFLVQLFGFRRRADDGRRFTSALYATARKAGKSTLAAAILLYCLCCEDEPGAQVISAATTFPQASIIFNVAKRMAEKLPALREAFGLETWAKALHRSEAGSTLRPIHAKASTQDGLNPSHTALDEIHAHKSPDLLNVLTSAAGARGNPLWLYTTTEGYESPGPWAEIREFSQKLLEGVFGEDADHFLALFWALDDKDDDFDERCWVKANPLIKANPHLLGAIRREAVEARQMPSKLAEFRIKRLNRRASSAESWVNLDKWRLGEREIPLAALAGVPCYGGLDLASTTDLAAFRLVWELDGTYYTKGWRWVPENSVRARSERGTVPYQGWVTAGLLKQTPGEVIDYAIIETDIRALVQKFNVQLIGYDRWNALDLATRLLAADVPLVEFVQGTKSFHPALRSVERAYISGKLVHGGDPVLTWCASNVVCRRDQNMNMAPDRKRSAEKIDDFVALTMAFGVSDFAAEPEQQYQTFFLA